MGYISWASFGGHAVKFLRGSIDKAMATPHARCRLAGAWHFLPFAVRIGNQNPHAPQCRFTGGAATRVDLLTVVMLECGHELGLAGGRRRPRPRRASRLPFLRW